MSYTLFDLNAGFSVVDVETTGDSANIGSVIEIGIVNVKNKRITDTFQSLIRPPVPVPSFITKLTGISDADLQAAPVFSEIATKALQMLEGNFFVAHHVHFDYGFLKSEYERLGKYFYMDRFCTVNLSRKFFPSEKKHNLDALIGRFSIPVVKRHRAYDDALATAETLIRFLEMPESEDVFSKYAETFDRRERWLERLEKQIFEIPNGKGVYFFKDAYDLPLYIGKSNTMRSRILQHLREDDINRKRRLLKFTDHFDFLPCETELEALILESKLIKKHLPPYNVQQRERRGYFFVKVTHDPYPRVFKTAVKKNDAADYIGPFRSSKFIDHTLERIQKHYRLCPELMKEKRSKKGFCFSFQLRQCDGACGEAITPEVYQEAVEEAAAVITEYIKLDRPENIDRFLRSRTLKSPDLKDFRAALRRTKSQIRETPEIFNNRYLVIESDERVGYLIQNGRLQRVLRDQELSDVYIEPVVHMEQGEENGEALDERLTIQRFVRSNRSKLQIVNLSA